MTESLQRLKPENVPIVAEFFDQDTNTFSYVVSDPGTSICAVIDSVWNLDYASGALKTYTADNIIGYIESENLKLEWIIETHVHADHVSAANYIKQKLGGKIAIGANITQVQKTFSSIFNFGESFACDGSQFDYLFDDNEAYQVGNIDALAISTPGHTPACMTHLIGDAAFVGDTIFMPHGGTARADFPGGDSAVLYDSIQRLYTLPGKTRLFMCHDYTEENPEDNFQSTVSEELTHNMHISAMMSKEDFIAMRDERDKTLGMPRYILPSLQINMRAGQLSKPASNGLSYLKIPINGFQ